jgi:hypothetical protein
VEKKDFKTFSFWAPQQKDRRDLPSLTRSTLVIIRFLQALTISHPSHTPRGALLEATFCAGVCGDMAK